MRCVCRWTGLDVRAFVGGIERRCGARFPHCHHSSQRFNTPLVDVAGLCGIIESSREHILKRHSSCLTETCYAKVIQAISVIVIAIQEGRDKSNAIYYISSL